MTKRPGSGSVRAAAHAATPRAEAEVPAVASPLAPSPDAAGAGTTFLSSSAASAACAAVVSRAGLVCIDGLPLIVTAFAPCGAVRYQNASSVLYYGQRLEPGAAALGEGQANGGQAAVGSCEGGAFAAAHPAGAGANAGQGAPSGLLMALFAVDRAKLGEMLATTLGVAEGGTGVWEGLVRVPTSLNPAGPGLSRVSYMSHICDEEEGPAAGAAGPAPSAVAGSPAHCAPAPAPESAARFVEENRLEPLRSPAGPSIPQCLRLAGPAPPRPGSLPPSGSASRQRRCSLGVMVAAAVLGPPHSSGSLGDRLRRSMRSMRSASTSAAAAAAAAHATRAGPSADATAAAAAAAIAATQGSCSSTGRSNLEAAPSGSRLSSGAQPPSRPYSGALLPVRSLERGRDLRRSVDSPAGSLQASRAASRGEQGRADAQREARLDATWLLASAEPASSMDGGGGGSTAQLPPSLMLAQRKLAQRPSRANYSSLEPMATSTWRVAQEHPLHLDSAASAPPVVTSRVSTGEPDSAHALPNDELRPAESGVARMRQGLDSGDVPGSGILLGGGSSRGGSRHRLSMERPARLVAAPAEAGAAARAAGDQPTQQLPAAALAAHNAWKQLRGGAEAEEGARPSFARRSYSARDLMAESRVSAESASPHADAAMEAGRRDSLAALQSALYDTSRQFASTLKNAPKTPLTPSLVNNRPPSPTGPSARTHRANSVAGGAYLSSVPAGEGGGDGLLDLAIAVGLDRSVGAAPSLLASLRMHTQAAGSPNARSSGVPQSLELAVDLVRAVAPGPAAGGDGMTAAAAGREGPYAASAPSTARAQLASGGVGDSLATGDTSGFAIDSANVSNHPGDSLAGGSHAGGSRAGGSQAGASQEGIVLGLMASQDAGGASGSLPGSAAWLPRPQPSQTQAPPPEQALPPRPLAPPLLPPQPPQPRASLKGKPPLPAWPERDGESSTLIQVGPTTEDGRAPPQGGAEEGTAGADRPTAADPDPLAWHELRATWVVDPSSGEAYLVLLQKDVTAKVEAERHIAQVTETEHRLLEQIFPRHVLAYMTEEGAAPQAVPVPPSPMLGSAAPTGSGPLVDWRPCVRDCTRLATWHPQVTILFADIQGFTPMCKQLAPAVVMKFLNDLFVRFDSLLDVYGVYKVETIGDCYVVAGGLIAEDADGMAAVTDSGRDTEQADKVVAFAQAMLRAARSVSMPTTGEAVRIRVGIHSGPVVSGVVGTRMPRFCLFGDTINTASRMESTSQAGCVHVSSDTYAPLSTKDPGWAPTGGIEVKGKGLMETHLWTPPQPVPSAHAAANGTSQARGSPWISSQAPPEQPPLPPRARPDRPPEDTVPANPPQADSVPKLVSEASVAASGPAAALSPPAPAPAAAAVPPDGDACSLPGGAVPAASPDAQSSGVMCPGAPTGDERGPDTGGRLQSRGAAAAASATTAARAGGQGSAMAALAANGLAAVGAAGLKSSGVPSVGWSPFVSSGPGGYSAAAAAAAPPARPSAALPIAELLLSAGLLGGSSVHSPGGSAEGGTAGGSNEGVGLSRWQSGMGWAPPGPTDAFGPGAPSGGDPSLGGGSAPRRVGSKQLNAAVLEALRWTPMRGGEGSAAGVQRQASAADGSLGSGRLYMALKSRLTFPQMPELPSASSSQGFAFGLPQGAGAPAQAER
ncbi:hypothetical protein HYH03_008607 [Edaphochlamys debaryana]|uniref:Guanylate cyclase domain-containing protein n=1 Tax=Edaphochlamys debaryana TaxID=47281 RepID=A0A835XY13_9CHLO|nr:hypothetical protein HYH03_008607 [Edaphochlamys debaryana]|eukprot:KAG2493187.1 hypothetical protein HYH03_008607 [Edaphochlamys debaryana]